jgi:prepilin-type N-terminal cleavage/methylation domain-containing protein
MNAIFNLRRRRGCRPLRRGFTLLEVAVTTCIIGVGTVAMLGLLAAGTNTNQQGALLTTAVDLANNIHELCDQIPYPSTGAWGLPGGQSVSAIFSSGSGNISWLDQQTISPPIDATANAISAMGSWTQKVSVTNVVVTPTTLTTLTPNSTANAMSNVTVTILCGGNQVYQTSWLVAK